MHFSRPFYSAHREGRLETGEDQLMAPGADPASPNKVISGFQALRQAKVPVAELNRTRRRDRRRGGGVE
ncbi:hypothetical protein PoB_005555200 [Plakobranchus ocellatus]|uniref:Uncharacterized protein n=1 Tax=Plakobranchus ocellatus TaxID=259542 RepID=A0AAV4CCH8_9GAST|nr:hypothetical protein PoB_005555200 [Plakobranchus ocellatus]